MVGTAGSKMLCLSGEKRIPKEGLSLPLYPTLTVKLDVVYTHFSLFTKFFSLSYASFAFKIREV